MNAIFVQSPAASRRMVIVLALLLVTLPACAEGPTEPDSRRPFMSQVAQPASRSVHLSVASAATAADDGPQDGIFDRLTPANLGSVNNNGFTSFRTALEFPLAAIPEGATIVASVLDFDVEAFEGPRSLEVHGYVGDGLAALTDVDGGERQWSGTVDGSGTQTFTVDVSGQVSSLVREGTTHAGYSFREEPANDANYTVMHVPVDRAVLSVTYVVERHVEIVVRPSDEGAPIVVRAGGHVPVAILSELGFDAVEEVDVPTLTLGKTGTELSLVFCNEGSDDVDLDGLDDLVCHFSIAASGLTAEDDEVTLLGRTRGDQQIRGVASVRIVGG